MLIFQWSEYIYQFFWLEMWVYDDDCNAESALHLSVPNAVFNKTAQCTEYQNVYDMLSNSTTLKCYVLQECTVWEHFLDIFVLCALCTLFERFVWYIEKLCAFSIAIIIINSQLKSKQPGNIFTPLRNLHDFFLLLRKKKKSPAFDYYLKVRKCLFSISFL